MLIRRTIVPVTVTVLLVAITPSCSRPRIEITAEPNATFWITERRIHERIIDTPVRRWIVETAFDYWRRVGVTPVRLRKPKESTQFLLCSTRYKPESGWLRQSKHVILTPIVSSTATTVEIVVFTTPSEIQIQSLNPRLHLGFDINHAQVEYLSLSKQQSPIRLRLVVIRETYEDGTTCHILHSLNERPLNVRACDPRFGISLEAIDFEEPRFGKPRSTVFSFYVRPKEWAALFAEGHREVFWDLETERSSDDWAGQPAVCVVNVIDVATGAVSSGISCRAPTRGGVDALGRLAAGKLHQALVESGKKARMAIVPGRATGDADAVAAIIESYLARIRMGSLVTRSELQHLMSERDLVAADLVSNPRLLREQVGGIDLLCVVTVGR